MAYAERSNGKLTGRWCADAEYKRADGLTTRIHKAYKTKEAAERTEAIYRATGEMPADANSGPYNSFASVAERHKQRNAEWHANVRHAQMLRFALDHMGKLDVRQIRTAQLEKFVDTMLARCGMPGKPPAANTVNNYLSVVRTILVYAEKLELIPSVPAMPRMEKAGKTRVAVSVAMENAICNWLESRGKAVSAFCVRVLAGTGMRRGELFGLKADQIETPEQIEHTGWQLSAEQTKTNEARWVPILPEAATKLRVLIASGKLPKGTHLSYEFREAARALGDTEGLTLHCLRHTTATRLEGTGVEALIIAKLLGHSTGLMTSRYFKPPKERLFEVAKKVQTALGETARTGEVVMLKDQQNRALSDVKIA